MGKKTKTFPSRYESIFAVRGRPVAVSRFNEAMATRPSRRSIPPAATVCLIALAVAIVGLCFFRCALNVHHATPIIVSLLYGFAPLIGLFFLQIIATVLFYLFICSVERELADDGPPIPKRSASTRLYPHRTVFSKTDLSLSLKEHSPPVSLVASY